MALDIFRRIRLALDKESAEKLEKDTKQALDKGTDPKKPTENLSKVEQAKKKLRQAAVRLGAALAAAFSVRVVVRFANELEGARRTLVRMTGASGNALRTLQDDTRAIFAQVPESIGEVATAVGTLNTLLGITGEELQSVAIASLDFARANEVDVATATELVGRLINRFGLEAQHAIPFLDRLNVAGQMTGASVNELAGNLLEAGPSLAAFGFSLNQQIALIAELERRGIQANQVTRRLGMSLGRMAQDGVTNGAEAFAQLLEDIQNAETELIAIGIAVEVFGTRGASLALDIRQGAFGIEELTAAMQEADGSVKSTEETSRTAGQEFKTMANSLWTRLIPAVEFVTSATLTLGTALFALVDGSIRVLQASVDLLILSWLALHRTFLEIVISGRKLVGKETTDQERRLEQLNIQIELTKEGINDLFSKPPDELAESGEDAADVFDRIKEALEGAADGVADTAEELRKLEDERIGLLIRARELGIATQEETLELLHLHDSINARIEKGNLAIEERIRLENRLREVQESLGMDPGARPVGEMTVGRGQGAFADPELNLPTSVSGSLRDPRQEVAGFTGFMLENFGEIETAAINAGYGISGAFQDAFEALIIEGEGAGTFLEALFRGTAAAIIGALAEVAAHKVKENVARAVEALATGFLTGSPAAFAAAKQYGVAAALWAAVGGAAGATQGAIAGGGRGGRSGGLPSGAADPVGRLADGVEGAGPEVHIYLDPLSPNDPRFQRVVAGAQALGRERYGDDARIFYHGSAAG